MNPHLRHYTTDEIWAEIIRRRGMTPRDAVLASLTRSWETKGKINAAAKRKRSGSWSTRRILGDLCWDGLAQFRKHGGSKLYRLAA